MSVSYFINSITILLYFKVTYEYSQGEDYISGHCADANALLFFTCGSPSPFQHPAVSSQAGCRNMDHVPVTFVQIPA